MGQNGLKIDSVDLLLDQLYFFVIILKLIVTLIFEFKIPEKLTFTISSSQLFEMISIQVNLIFEKFVKGTAIKVPRLKNGSDLNPVLLSTPDFI